MGVKIGSTAGYMYMDMWVLASIIQLGTFSFCRRFLNQKNDPCGRLFDQMTQAARSGQANIAEGVSRHQTSIETEMKLVDVARASINELSNDFSFILMANKQVAWRNDDPNEARCASLWRRHHARHDGACAQAERAFRPMDRTRRPDMFCQCAADTLRTSQQHDNAVFREQPCDIQADRWFCRKHD